ncbi:MAG: hypothetical protein ACXW1W_03925 [Methylococcaceae bacterium]
MKFIQSFFIAGILTCVIFYAAVLLLIDAPVKAGYFNSEMLTIKKALVKEYTGKQKIIIAGGSSTLFGIDAEYASKSLNIPVINFGLTAGLRLEKILNEVDSVIEQDDYLILPLEPTYYDCNYYGKLTSSQVTDIIAYDHDAWKKMNYTEKLEFISLVSPTIFGQMLVAKTLEKLYPATISDRLIARNPPLVLSKFHARVIPTEFAYSAYNLNSSGDMLGTEGSKYKGPDDDVSQPVHVCDKAAIVLTYFIDRMRKKGVHVFFANTPYPLSKPSTKTWESSELNFANQLAPIGCIIDKREDLVLDRKYFFNTHLHLNNEGRTRRTDAIIKAIRKNILTGKCEKTREN